ncbi:MAG: hypothetical protein JWP86_1229, partial [Phenylobacterium sp.]|nr:hypothetical protein [Phenylobacterium sp.]
AVAGALGGGLLGQALSVRTALLVAALGLAIVPALGCFSPLSRLRNISAT